MDSAIEVQGLTKTYRTGVRRHVRTAVSALHLDVPGGRIVGLLGPNGAGKTTTLKSIMGFVRPDAGTIRIFGEDARAAGVHRRLGFLPEQPYFYSYLRGEQTLGFYGRLCGMDAASRKTRSAELLDLVGLTESAQMRLSKYSRGMLQRLGIAQALINDPELVILDEPASGLDPIGQKEMRNVILRLKDQGKTVLLSSHQLSEVEAVCDSVSIVDRGRVRREGTLDELLNVSNANSITAVGKADGLDDELKGIAEEVIRTGDTYRIAVPAPRTYEALGILEREGLALLEVVPKRLSLEEYFIRLVEGERRGD